MPTGAIAPRLVAILGMIGEGNLTCRAVKFRSVVLQRLHDEAIIDENDRRGKKVLAGM